MDFSGIWVFEEWNHPTKDPNTHDFKCSISFFKKGWAYYLENWQMFMLKNVVVGKLEEVI